MSTDTLDEQETGEGYFGPDSGESSGYNPGGSAYDYTDDSELFDQHLYGTLAEKSLSAIPPGESIEQLQHRAATTKMAADGRTAEEEILRRDQEGAISPENTWRVEIIKQKVQEEKDRQIVQGLATGKLVIASQEDRQRLTNNANARARIRASRELNDEQKNQLEADIFADDTKIRRAATNVPPEAVPHTPEFLLRKTAGQISPEDRAANPLVFDNGVPQVVRGFTKAEPPEKKPDEQRNYGGGKYTYDEWVAGAGLPNRGPKNAPVIESREEYDKLRPGAFYTGPNGKVSRKKMTQDDVIQAQWEREQQSIKRTIGPKAYAALEKRGAIAQRDQKTGKVTIHEAPKESTEKPTNYSAATDKIRAEVEKQVTAYADTDAEFPVLNEKGEEMQKYNPITGTRWDWTKQRKPNAEEIKAKREEIQKKVIEDRAKVEGLLRDTSLPVVKTDEDYAKLPSGTRFRAPDGKIREKP